MPRIDFHQRVSRETSTRGRPCNLLICVAERPEKFILRLRAPRLACLLPTSYSNLPHAVEGIVPCRGFQVPETLLVVLRRREPLQEAV